MCLFHFHMVIRPLWPQSWLLNLTWLHPPQNRNSSRLSKVKSKIIKVVEMLHAVSKWISDTGIREVQSATRLYNSWIITVIQHMPNYLRCNLNHYLILLWLTKKIILWRKIAYMNLFFDDCDQSLTSLTVIVWNRCTPAQDSTVQIVAPH